MTLKNKVKYVIPDIPPSNNKFIGRTNKWEYQSNKKHWADLVYVCCTPKPITPFTKARVTLVYYFKNRIRHDPDNYSGKFILDGLVKANILIDDSFGNVELQLVGDYDKNNPRTEIWIEALGD